MRHFNNLIYVSHGTTDETEGLMQSLRLARDNNASLKVLVACPVFPKKFPDFKKKYEASLLGQANDSILAARQALEIEDGAIDVAVELASDNKPSVRIVQHVLRDGHDLLIKDADTHHRGRGFRAIDMALLRQCPCPVWLCRPIKNPRERIQVGVAIDPQSEEDVAQKLSRRMLQISQSMADDCSGKLHVVSCWDFEFEEVLRHNPWVQMDDKSIDEEIAKARSTHRAALERLISESKLTGPQVIHHLRGVPEKMVSAFVSEEKIDILVMGTVARTGIPGFTIGNTAENIMQELPCSLIALKPQGFVSPVKAYK